jgi:hypothetical protein
MVNIYDMNRQKKMCHIGIGSSAQLAFCWCKKECSTAYNDRKENTWRKEQILVESFDDEEPTYGGE